MPNKSNLYEVALSVLERHQDADDLCFYRAKVARETIAKEMSEEATYWIRNLWKEDFEKPE